MAIKPFEFSNGAKLEVGDWACTPLRAMLHDEQHFPDPLQFNGFRFVDRDQLADLTSSDFGSHKSQEPAQLTDVNKHWHVWGTGRMAWYVNHYMTMLIYANLEHSPGRFYAAAVMKMIVGQFILKYDCELVDKDASRWFSWRSFIYPRSKTLVNFRPISVESNQSI